MPTHIPFNITLPLRRLSLDWLLHCLCVVKAFTVCFPDYFQKFSAILLLLIIESLPPFYIPKSSSTNLRVTHNLWYFYSAIYITCFDCNFPLSTCLQFWKLSLTDWSSDCWSCNNPPTLRFLNSVTRPCIGNGAMDHSKEMHLICFY